VSAAPPLRNDILRGILFMCLASSVFPVMNALVKVLSDDYPTTEIVWARVLGHLIFITLLFSRQGVVRLYRTRAPKLQFFRSVFALGSNVLYFWALAFLPLADMAAISFTSPFVVAALSVPMLGEQVGWRRWTAIGVGFLGALLIIRPGSDAFHWAALLVVGSSVCYAVYQILTRKVAGTDPPETSAAFHPMVGTVLLSLAVPFVWVTPKSFVDLGIFCVLGVLGGIGHYCVARALMWAPASVVSPFNYVQLVGSTVFGIMLFGDFPTAWTFAGALVIVASGLYIAIRERKLGQDNAIKATSPPGGAT
jgi:drug/metabolite transporter (DMT)-like permease